MATPASTEDGTKNIEHHYVNLEEQSFINCQLPHVKGRPKFGKQISPSNLARQKHSIRRNTPWHSNKGHWSKTIKRHSQCQRNTTNNWINNSGLNKFPTAGAAVPLPASYKPPQRTQKKSAAASTQTTNQQTTEQQPRLPIMNSSITTAPTHQHQSPALPSPKRTLPVPGGITEGSFEKHQQGSQDQKQPQNHQHLDNGSQKSRSNKERQRNYSVCNRRHQRTHHRDDPLRTDHQQHWRTRQPTYNTRREEGDTADETTKCMHRHTDTPTLQQRQKIVQSRWVLRNKGTEVRARIVAKGFTEPVKQTLTTSTQVHQSTAC